MLRQVKQEAVPSAEFTTIDQTTACEMLESNGNNRQVKKRNLETLIREMQRGAFQPNGDSIKFNIAGELIDGQHRLMAIAETGLTQTILVVRDLPLEAKATLDQGAKRTAADIASFSKVTNAVILTSASRRILNAKLTGSPLSNKGAVSNIEVVEWLLDDSARLTCLEKWIGELHGCTKEHRLIESGTALAWRYLCSEVDAVAAEQFFHRLSAGLFSSKDDPVRLLRERLIKAASDYKAHQLTPLEKSAYLVKAWNAFRTHSPIKMLRYGNKEAFPSWS